MEHLLFYFLLRAELDLVGFQLLVGYVNVKDAGFLDGLVLVSQKD